MAVKVKERDQPARSQRETRGDRTRAAIVQAATGRFAAQGFDSTTLADVAADAGVSGPSVAFHFGNKDGLLAAVMEQYFAALLAGAQETVAAPGSPRERLQAFMEFWFRSQEGAFDLYSVFATQGGWRQIDSESGAAIRDGYRAINAVVDRLIDDMKSGGTVRAEVSTRLVRDSLMGASEWVMRGRLHTAGRPDYDRDARDLLSIVIDGAGAPAGPPPDEDRLGSIEKKIDRLLKDKNRKPR